MRKTNKKWVNGERIEVGEHLIDRGTNDSAGRPQEASSADFENKTPELFRRRELPDDIGPDGHQVLYSADGDMFEMEPLEDGTYRTYLMQRCHKTILATFNEYNDKIWWMRHQTLVRLVKSGEITLTASQKEMFDRAEMRARKIEKKQGKQNLIVDGLELEIMNGRFSALAWVLGIDWEHSLEPVDVEAA